jgi:hypothetical protein
VLRKESFESLSTPALNVKVCIHSFGTVCNIIIIDEYWPHFSTQYYSSDFQLLELLFNTIYEHVQSNQSLPLIIFPLFIYFAVFVVVVIIQLHVPEGYRLYIGVRFNIMACC